MIDPPEPDIEAQARALAARVEAGTLGRDALELLAGVDHRASQRALGLLPLVLTAPPPAPALEPGAPPHAATWTRWARGLEAYDRELAVAVALAACELVRPALDAEIDGAAWELIGLHTGPAGAVTITREQAASLLPLSALSSRLLEAVARWLSGPSPEAARAVAGTWPPLLDRPARAELVGELTGVDGRALWVHRSLVEAVIDPSPTAATAAVLTGAESVVGSRGPVAAAVRAVLVPRLAMEP
ncbi:MAG TPA: hypothetical protein VIL20_18985 [Sandaracinaceae bacterium]